MKKYACLLLLVLLLFGVGASLYRYGQWRHTQRNMASVYEPVYEMMEDAPTLDAPTTAPILPSPSQIQQVANHYESVIGWLEIPGVLR